MPHGLEPLSGVANRMGRETLDLMSFSQNNAA